MGCQLYYWVRKSYRKQRFAYVVLSFEHRNLYAFQYHLEEMKKILIQHDKVG